MNRDRYWIAAIPLEVAYLCVNCDTVGNIADNCPACAAGPDQLLSLWKILNRDTEKKEDPDA